MDLAPALIGALGLLVSVFVVRMQIEASYKDKRKSELAKKLNEFYGPFQQLRDKSNRLYQEFSAPFKEKDSKFSTLRYLFDGGTFKGDAEILIGEIVSIGDECEQLIHAKAGLIDDRMIRTELLPMLTTHYRLIRLAIEKKLTGEIKGIRQYSFPTAIDKEVDRRIEEIEAEMARLSKRTRLMPKWLRRSSD